VVCGIGKANAAGAVARVADPDRHALVVSVGVAGALPHLPHPGASRADVLPLRSVIAATGCIFMEEGLQESGRFLDCFQLGFPLGPPPFSGNSAEAPPAARRLLGSLADTSGWIATVSTCSGTDDLARLVAERTARGRRPWRARPSHSRRSGWAWRSGSCG
jgi:hypothetical protein